MTKENFFKKLHERHRERMQKLEKNKETKKEGFLMAHTRACLYADEKDPGVREKLVMKKREETITCKVRWKPEDRWPCMRTRTFHLQ